MAAILSPATCDRMLTRSASRARRFAAFTLVEMLVALAVLLVALSVVGVAFSVTTKTASQAAAYSEVRAAIDETVRQLEEDLREIEPSQSVLVVVGSEQRAALTQPLLDARRPYELLTRVPRADKLLFFTNRAQPSQAPPIPSGSAAPTPVTPYVSGAKFSPLLVAYGHAAFDDAIVAPTGNAAFANRVRHISDTAGSSNLSAIPAARWMLSRRATILHPSSAFTADAIALAGYPSMTRIVGCQPGPAGAGVEAGLWNGDWPGDAAAFNLAYYLTFFNPYDSGGVRTGRALRSPYGPSGLYSSDSTAAQLIDRVLYASGAPGTTHHVATVLRDAPADLRTNMSLQMLPGCMWFQVELLLPEDPRNSPDYEEDVTDPARPRRFDPPPWYEVPSGETYVFVPDNSSNRELVASGATAGGTARLFQFGKVVDRNEDFTDIGEVAANRRIRMWPYAIRITIRAIDANARLPEPIVRTVVHRFD